MPLDTSSDLRERTHCIEQVVSLLLAGKYQELEWLSRGVRLDATAIERAVSTYGRMLIEAPVAGPGPNWVRIRTSSHLHGRLMFRSSPLRRVFLTSLSALPSGKMVLAGIGSR